jgi:hypothetical protein
MPKDGSLVALPAARGVPEPLRRLGPEGQKLWERIWGAGALWLSPGTDSESVMLVCESMDERMVLRAKVFTENDWHDRNALRALDAQLMTGLGSLGFDPLNRSRLGVAEVKQVTALEELAARRASGANRATVVVEPDA